MRAIVLAFTMLLLCGGVVRSQESDPAEELKKIPGDWLVAHRSYTPSKATNEVGKLLTELGHEVKIGDDKLSARDPKKAGVHFLVDFDPTTTPTAVDLKLPGKKNRVLRGIYRLEDDILSLSVGTGDSRPETFDDPENQVLLILKRAPRKAPK